MNRPLCLVDYDNCCVDLVGGICDYLTGKYVLKGHSPWFVPVTPADCTDYGMMSLVNKAAPEHRAAICREIVALFSNPRFMHDLKPLPGAQAAVRQLAERYDIWVLTSRRYDTMGKVTAKSVATHFPWFEDNRALRIKHAENKAAYAKANRASVVYEDNGNTAAAIAKAGVNVVLISQPYNLDVSIRSRFFSRAASLLDATKGRGPSELDQLWSKQLQEV